MVAANSFVYLPEDVFTFFKGNVLHEDAGGRVFVEVVADKDETLATPDDVGSFSALGSTCGGSLNSLMKSINWIRQSSSIISTSLTVAGASISVACWLCTLTDGWLSSWTKTPGGTAA